MDSLSKIPDELKESGNKKEFMEWLISIPATVEVRKSLVSTFAHLHNTSFSLEELELITINSLSSNGGSE